MQTTEKPFFKAILFCLTLSLIFFSRAGHSFSDGRWTKKIAPEITYTHIKTRNARGPLHIYFLKVDQYDPRIKVKPAFARRRIGAIEPVSSIGIRENALAAINGSFFESRKFPHLPIGTMVVDGKIINKSLLNRAAMGITGSGCVIFGLPKIKGQVMLPGSGPTFSIWGINRPRKNHEVILYTREYGETTKTNKWGKEVVVENGRISGFNTGNSRIPESGCVLSFHGWTRQFIDKMRPGNDVIITFGLTGDWEMADQVISGGPLLIKDGEIVAEASIAEENFDGVILRPTARTAVGTNSNGELLLFVVDAKRGYSVGATFPELARMMKDEGVTNAMGLDGGGSSTLFLDGEIKNQTMYRHAYPVSNALVVLKEGYRYVAKVPKVAPKIPEWMMVERLSSPTWEASWDSGWALYSDSPPQDMLTDMYQRLVGPMLMTTEAEGQQNR